MSTSLNYGSKYFGITGEGVTLYLMADRMEVLPNGALVAWGGFRKDEKAPKPDDDKEMQSYCIAAGQWRTFFAASMLDGRMLCDCGED